MIANILIFYNLKIIYTLITAAGDHFNNEYYESNIMFL